MTMMRRMSLALLVSGLAGACSPVARPSNSTAKIYGGQAVTGAKWSSTVAIVINEGQTTDLCTGTLITTKLVMTAAHCLTEDGKTTPLSAFSVVVGNDARGTSTHTVVKANYKPEYRDDPINDMAYLVLSDEAAGVEIIEPATDDAEIKALTTPGAQATLVGFGSTDTKDASGQAVIGIKYETQTQVGQPVDGALFVGGNGKDSCQGDSGGPAYGQTASGQWRVFGVTSRGAGCGQGGLYARMNEGLCWVEKDSGIKLPNSKLACDGNAGTGADVAAAGTAAAGTGSASGGIGSDIRMRLGSIDPTVPDAYEVDLAAPKAVVRMSICAGTRDTCIASAREDLACKPVSKDDPSLAYFVGERRVKLSANLTVTFLGFDQGGFIIQARSVTFGKRP